MSFLRKQESRGKNWIPCQAWNDITADIIYAGVNKFGIIKLILQKG